MDQINFLPDHILAEIFGNLSPRMIKCCALVCKRWDNVIGTSTETMGRFKLNLYQKSNQDIQEAKELQRNHQAIEGYFKDESLDVIIRHNLKSLSLSTWDFDDTKLSLLIKTLNDLTLLKYLDLRLFRFHKDYVSDDHEKLKNNFVELSCDLDILHLFECCTVEKLNLSWRRTNDKMNMQAIDFLNNQKNLKTLELIDGFDGELFNLPGILEFKFSLKKLEVHCQENPFQYYDSLTKFLNRHKNSLTHLMISFYTEPEFGIELIHKFALENLVNLKHLEMGHIKNVGGEYEDDKLTFDELPAPTQITKNLESLLTTSRSTDMNENKRFYDMFPNLKRLHLDLYTSDCNQVLECINKRCVNIESLDIGRLERNGKIYFPNLKELTVHSYSKEKYLCSFIRRHSQTLEKIILEEDEIGLNLAANEILNCPNINYLKMVCLRTNLTVLKAFNEISQKSTPFTLFVSRSQFKFPDDKAIWDVEIKAYQRDHYPCHVQ